MYQKLLFGILILVSLGVVIGGVNAALSEGAQRSGYHEVLYANSIEVADPAKTDGKVGFNSDVSLPVSGALKAVKTQGNPSTYTGSCDYTYDQMRSINVREVSSAQSCPDNKPKTADVTWDSCSLGCPEDQIVQKCPDSGDGSTIQFPTAQATATQDCYYTCQDSSATSYVKERTCTAVGDYQEIVFDDDGMTITSGYNQPIEGDVVRLCVISLKEEIAGSSRDQEIDSVNMVPVPNDFGIRDCRSLATSSAMLHGTSRIGDRARYGVGCLRDGGLSFSGYVHNNDIASAPYNNCGWTEYGW